MSNKKWYQFWKSEQKNNLLNVLIRQHNSGFNQYNFRQFVDEAYKQNQTVYACVQEYVKAFIACPIVIKRNDEVITNTSLKALLSKPNEHQTWEDFIGQAVIYYLVGGECPIYGESAIPSRLPQKLYILRPDFLTPLMQQAALSQQIAYWQYSASDQSATSLRIIPSDLVLWKNYDPTCQYRGFSPLTACAYAIDQINEYAKANYSLLKNGLQPSGALSTESNMDDGQFDRVKNQFDDKYAGSENNGRPLILEGGLSWQPFGFNMRDAEFLGGKTSAKRDICEALGVPNQLIGLEGSQTFANYEHARASFYEDSAIPLFESLLSVLNKWLGWRVGLKPDDMLLVDVDAVTALEPRRAERNKALDTMQSISTNEKRAAMGYEPVEGGDTLLVNSGLIPLDMAGADIPPVSPML